MEASVSSDATRSRRSKASRPLPGASLLHPVGAVDLDELLHSFSPGQPQPDRTSFAGRAYVDIEERAADALAGGPFGEEAIGRRVGGELELVAVRKLPDTHPQLAQLRPQLVEVSLALLGRERRDVAGQGGLPVRRRVGRLRSGGRQKSRHTRGEQDGAEEEQRD